MLSNRFPLNCPSRGGYARRERGVVMLVALVVLVVMTLAGIGLMRSMDTTNLIAGNMAFKQAATQSADEGVEAAIGWLEKNNAGGVLDASNAALGYSASSPNNAALPLGEGFWTLMAGSGVCYLPMTGGGTACSAAPGTPNTSGNTISFMIQRLCAATGNRNGAGCSITSGTVVSSGNNEGAGEELLTGTSNAVFYRITARSVGPRNTVSYVQAIVSM